MRTDLLHHHRRHPLRVRMHARTHARNRKVATCPRRKAQLSARGCDGCTLRCADACREASYIIYSVLSPGGPSVMAVLCPIKITTGAPRRGYSRLGGPAIELIYSPNIRGILLNLLHFVIELTWRRRPLRMEIGDRCSTWTVIAVNDDWPYNSTVRFRYVAHLGACKIAIRRTKRHKKEMFKRTHRYHS